MTIPSHLRVDFLDGATQTHYADDHNLEFAKVNTLIDHVEDSTQPLGLVSVTASTYSAAVDLTGKSHVQVNLDANIGTLEFTWPAVCAVDVSITQDATGGRTISIADVVWQGGDEPIVDTTASATTTVTLVSTDGGTTIRGYHGQLQQNYQFCSNNGVDLATATNISDNIIIGPIRILYVVAFVRTAPTGQSIILDLNWNGTTIYSTQGNRPTIAAGATQSSTTLPNTTLLAPSGGTPGRLGLDVDQVGTTAKGQGLSVLVRALALN